MLTISDIHKANLTRVLRWHPEGLQCWSPLEWAGAMAGEAGEACNAAKKLWRIKQGVININLEKGRSLTELDQAHTAIAKEVADTIIYGLLLMAAIGKEPEDVIREVFNKKSEEYGFPERL